MSVMSYILGIVASIFALGLVLWMLRGRKLRERHAIWWLIAGLGAVIISVFPQTLTWVAGLFGVQVPTNLVFFASIAVLFFVALQSSAELTTLEAKTRRLAEDVALHQHRLEELEKRQSKKR
jgi:hypothetical protein